LRCPTLYATEPGNGLPGAAVGSDAEDLAGEGGRVLGEWAIGRVAGARVEHPVRSELQDAAVVVDGAGDAGDDRLARAERGAVVGHALDAVLGGGGEVDVDQGIGVVGRGDGEPEEAALTASRHS
jgi:hypothetical protein